MPKYLVMTRSAKSQSIHPDGSVEATVCAIAKNLMHYRGPTDGLMAIPADTKVATFAALKDEALCSIEVTDKTLATWRKDVFVIEDAINSFQSARDHAETMLDRALAELDEAYGSSSDFNDYTPSNDISVYGALDQLGANDLEYKFQQALREMYKFNSLKVEQM